MLVRWSTDGELVSRLALGLAGEYAFLPAGRLLITGLGDLVDTRTAGVIGHLAPPQSG
jgi:hypothetical protein